MNEAKSFGIISIKGGVGKTSCTVNLAAALASEFNKNVLAVDANYSAPNLGLHFGIVNPPITINHVLKKNLHISHAIHKYHDKLHVVPGSIIGRKVNPFELRNKLNVIKDNYDAILIDSSPNLNHEMLSTIAASDRLLVVTTPDMPTLSCTLHAIKVANKRKIPISGLILNRVRNKNFELSIDELEDACEIPVLAVIPEDVNMLESLALTKPVTSHKPLSDVSINYIKLAAAMAGRDYRDPRFFSKLKEMFHGISRDEINRISFRNEKR